MKFKLSVMALAVAGAVNAQAQTPPPQLVYYSVPGKPTVKITAEELQIRTTLSQVGVPAAWARGYTGAGSTIAILDQGFDLNHYDLKNSILAYKNFYPGSIRSTNQGWGFHGTAMASIVGADLQGGVGTVGVAPDSQLLLGQVGQGGKLTNINSAAVINGLNWAGEQGAVAVNLSYTSTFDKNYIAGTTQIAPGVWQGNSKYAAMYGQINTFNAFKTSTNTNSVIVAAAGNQGLAYSGFPGAFATATNADGSLTFGGRWLIVGSVNSNNQISRFSNQAGHICTNVVSGACQDTYQVKDFYVVAPGERVIVSADTSQKADYLATVSTGTSPATAVVSGGIALIHQAWPQLKAADIVALVKNTATDLGKPGVDEVYGHGLVNFDKATQPYADLKYSKVELKSGPAVSGTTLKTTGLSGSGGVATALSNSTVLKNVQVVDGLNRNFTADFTRAIGTRSPANSLYASPYLAMQSAGYREFSVPLGKDSSAMFMQTNSGLAIQLDTKYSDSRVQFQFGTMSEQYGFLNNSGSGLFATGGSSTSYAMFGGSKPITENIDLIGNYGIGYTRTNNVDGSFLAASNLVSDTWKLGFDRKNIFFNSKKTQDKITVALHGPVSIRKGYADVTAITGYTYSGESDDITANPVTTTERVNLAGNRQVNMMLGYSVQTGNTTYMGVNVSKNPNISNSTTLGFVVRSVF